MRTPYLVRLPLGITSLPRPPAPPKAPPQDARLEARRKAGRLRVAEDAAVADLAGRTLGVVPGDRAMAPLRPGLAASDVRHALRVAFRRGVEAGLGPS